MRSPQTHRRGTLGLAIGLCAGIVCVTGLAQTRELPASFSGLVKDLLPAVVNISTTQAVEGAPQITPPFSKGSPLDEFFRDFFGGLPQGLPQQVSALGSGFIIDPEGYVVTNSHVVAMAKEIRVILSDERTFTAEIIGTDEPTDLALLKIDAAEPLPFVRWGRSEATEIGDWVIAIGNPFGLGGTVTTGVLSGRARDIRAGPYDNFLQTDAAINRGNSGGPLFSDDGKVIGVNTVILSPSGGNIGIGFAIPSSTAMPIFEQLRKSGVVRRGWLGVQIQPVTGPIAEAIGLPGERGALVADVVENGPAARGGLKAGDVILGFDGQPVEKTRDLPRIVANTEIGKTVKMSVWRGGETRTLEVTIAEREPEKVARLSRPGQHSDGEDDRTGVLGMRLAPLEAKLRGRLGLAEDTAGVVVVALKADSPAAKEGIRPGDVIREINGKSVSTPKDAKAQIDTAIRKQKALLLRIYRNGSNLFAAIPASEIHLGRAE